MALLALADLHLSLDGKKPMDIFAPIWHNHMDKIAANWRRVVKPQDMVLIPGDISWALKLEEALPDLKWLAQLPGEKLLLRGNHDYWWSGIGKVRRALPPNIQALQNDHFAYGKWAICGSRGWLCPGNEGFDYQRDERIYLREVQRLELSLKSAQRAGYEKIVVALHYPPTNGKHEESGFTTLFAQYPVKKCVYGHLHGAAQATALRGKWRGVFYHLVAADAVDFTPVVIIK
ncbi:MAG: hypothetical protein GX349_03940 [Firmicutes bacterium]|nr:hypothetical protein [Bacillota bacterium]